MNMRFDDVIHGLGIPKPRESVASKIEWREQERADRARAKVARQNWAVRLGARIRRRREYLGMTAAELARRAGYASSSFLLEIERGEHVPTDAVLRKLCAAMGEPFEDDEEGLP